MLISNPRVIALTLATLTAPVAAADLVNGDFESGNTGFTTNYAYRSVSDGVNYGQYGVTHSSFEWSHFWSTMTADHTKGDGTGQFLIVDVGPNGTIWQETTNVSASTQYTFGAWLATWTPFPAATLLISINGQTIATWGGPGGATWTQHTATWNSGNATSATITISAASFFQPGDDIAIDDITFTPVPGAASLASIAGLTVLRRRRR